MPVTSLDRDELIAKGWELNSDPLAERFWARARTGNNTLSEPEDVLGQRLLMLSRLLLDGTDDSRTRAADGYTDEDRWMSLTLISQLALGAIPHLWSEAGWSKIWDLKLPDHIISPRALPLPHTWHTWTNPRGNNDCTLLSLMITDGGTGILVTEFWITGQGDESELALDRFDIPYGKTWPEDFSDDDGRIEATLQLLAFLSSPYIPRSQERMTRGARREVARNRSQSEPDDEVTFVLLRRLGGYKRSEPETETEVAWKHRWLVSGHLRAQWYPSEGAHHLIWIAPYMKGPEDAPLLEHVYKVAR